MPHDPVSRPLVLRRLMVEPRGRAAPAWSTVEWFNTQSPIQLADLRGRVVVLHAFQMLCPGCVQHGLPQAQRIHAAFDPGEVAVIGLHTVFEHHAAMTPVSLRAFLHEYRIGFAVGVDAPTSSVDEAIPATMQAYEMQGTPSLVLIDRHGDLRHQSFGVVDDIEVGAAIAALVLEG